MSDERFPVQRLQLVDVDSRLRIANLSGFAAPLTHVRAHVVLDQGVLTFSDVASGIYGGSLSGTARLDTRTPTPQVKIKGVLRGGELAALRPRSQAAISGSFNVNGDLAGNGVSLHGAASHASGHLGLHVDQGRTSRAVDFMVGGDLLRAAGSLGDTRRVIQLDCASAAFDAEGGTLSSRAIVLQTPSGITTGTGSVNLASEQINLLLTGHPIRKKLFQLDMPVMIRGPLAHPSVFVLPGRNATALGLKGKLGVLMSPLAAIIPLKRATEPPARCAPR